jgi:ParB family transcriptional regulator, chromosome partitioning protein
MDVEFHQLDLRYEELRSRSPARERRLLSSLEEVGQQTPIVVVVSAPPASGSIVIDGYKRVRLLRRLGHDTVRATAWELGEADALLLERMMRAGEADSALEQGWFLRELRDRFGLDGASLAQRVGRSESWVSRRLGLVAELPESMQRHVRAGAIGAHAAMKHLLPLARANRADAERLADAVAKLKLSTRQMATVGSAWSAGDLATRALILKDPGLVLRAHAEARRARERPQTPADQMLADLSALGGLAGRLQQRLRRGGAHGLLAPEREEIRRVFDPTRLNVEHLLNHLAKELDDARPEHPGRDPAAA